MKRSNVIVFCFVIFIPASSSPVLHCSVIPLCLEKHLVVSFFFFSPALLSSLFFSLISYFLCGRRHFMFVLAQVAFGPRTEWAAMGGRKPDFPLLSSSQLPQSEPWTPSLLLHLPSSSSPAFYPFSLPSLSSPRSLTYGCSSTAKPTEMTTFLWLTVFVLHLKNLNFTLRDHI